MIGSSRVCVVLPAYNAAGTLERTLAEVPEGVDRIVLVDDASHDATAELGRRLGLEVIVHDANRGYGGNQKTCYCAALAGPEEIVVLLHPDYQYSPKLVTAMAAMLDSGHYDVALASRILGGTARGGGMPWWRYLANRGLTAFENLLLGAKLSEFHTGFRAFRREVLERLPLAENSDDFVFDNQILVQALAAGYRIAEISCPTRYFEEASSIGFGRSVSYGFGVLGCATAGLLHRAGIHTARFLRPDGRRLAAAPDAPPAP
jgi:glycosyltransferase involved in cell wall biosynthesis